MWGTVLSWKTVKSHKESLGRCKTRSDGVLGDPGNRDQGLRLRHAGFANFAGVKS